MRDPVLALLQAKGVLAEGPPKKKRKKPTPPRTGHPAYLRVKSKTDVQIAVRRPFTATREFGLEKFDDDNAWSAKSLTRACTLPPSSVNPATAATATKATISAYSAIAM